MAGYSDSLINFRGPLLAALVDSGREVHVAAPGLIDNKPVMKTLESWKIACHNIYFHRTAVNPFTDLYGVLQLYWMIKKIKPELIFTYTIKSVIYGSLCSRIANVPARYSLITGLGYAFTGEVKGHRRLVSFFAKLLYRMALRHNRRVFFQNVDDDFLFRQLKLLPAHVPSTVVNGSGVDVSWFRQMPLPKKLVSFLLIARLLGDKGVREYAKAAFIMKELYPDVEFNLVGWRDDNPDCIRSEELTEWQSRGLNFLGHLKDVRPAICNCSVYVLPSYREGTPRTVLEAMAIGRPIITTDTPGCRETVIDGENGFLVPVKSVDGLVRAMKEFVENPELAQQMGARSRQIAEEKYDVHKVNALMLREMEVAL